MKEKILTQEIVEELGLNKVSVITADMLEGYTGITSDAFVDCKSLTSVTIPDSVMSIGWCAFCDCSSLTSVTIPDSVTSIGNYAFYRCSSLTSISIPNGVTNLGMRAFSGCKSLVSIIIPNSVKSIGYGAFKDCTSLTSVKIPDSVTSIENSVFSGCKGLTSVTIPNSVTSIGKHAFYNCASLTSVTIGDKTYENQTVNNGKCKAYKAFGGSMACRGFRYEESKTYEFNGKPKLCECGFHSCLNLADVFNYYWGKIDKDVVVHEVELEGVTNERKVFDSKVVARKITIGKRIL